MVISSVPKTSFLGPVLAVKPETFHCPFGCHSFVTRKLSKWQPPPPSSLHRKVKSVPTRKPSGHNRSSWTCLGYRSSNTPLALKERMWSLKWGTSIHWLKVALGSKDLTVLRQMSNK